MCQLDYDGLTVFKSSVSLLIFCLVLSVAERKTLKSPSIIADLPILLTLSIVASYI